jgi:hypothetical protein
LLPWLIGGAIGAGGIFQGMNWRSSARSGDVSELENQLRIATEENDLLKRENESLRSLAQGGGELAVPQEFVDRIEKEYGLKFRSTPVVHQIGGDELRDRISAACESRFGPNGLDFRQEAYQRIGWLLPDDDLLSQLTAVRSVGARGWFDDEMGDAWVTDKFKIENIPDQAVLVRLLARILLQQNFPPGPDYPGDDTARAREALQVGAASGSEANFYAANARAIGFMPTTENLEAEQLLNSLSPLVQALTMFPILEGKAFVDALHTSGGDEAFKQALREQPQTTKAISQTAAERKAPADLEMPAVEGEPFLSERAGELGLRLWIEPVDVEAALDIASAWKNDRYVLFPDGENSSAVIWDVVFETVALNQVSGMAGREDESKAGVAVETLEKRFLLVSRPAADRVRFLNAARKETAEKLK